MVGCDAMVLLCIGIHGWFGWDNVCCMNGALFVGCGVIGWFAGSVPSYG